MIDAIREYEEDGELDDVLQETFDMYALDPESLTEQVEKDEDRKSTRLNSSH